MSARQSADDVLSAMRLMQSARGACDSLPSVDEPVSEQERLQRAALIDKLTRTRRLLRHLRDRAERLQDDLDQLKRRHGTLHG